MYGTYTHMLLSFSSSKYDYSCPTLTTFRTCNHCWALPTFRGWVSKIWTMTKIWAVCSPIPNGIQQKEGRKDYCSKLYTYICVCNHYDISSYSWWYHWRPLPMVTDWLSKGPWLVIYKYYDWLRSRINKGLEVPRDQKHLNGWKFCTASYMAARR